MAGRAEHGAHSLAEVDRLVERHLPEELQRLRDIAGDVERGLYVARLAGLVSRLSHGPLPVLVLKLRRIVEDDLRDRPSAADGIDRTAKSLIGEQRQAAAVIQVPVREEYGVYFARLEREGLSIQ